MASNLISATEEEIRQLSEGEMIAIEVIGSGKSSTTERALIQRTFRLYSHVSFSIDALAENMGWSRNEAANRLIAAGVDAVRRAVVAHDPEKASELFALKGEKAFKAAMSSDA
jgi:hypothetical protein